MITVNQRSRSPHNIGTQEFLSCNNIIIIILSAQSTSIQLRTAGQQGPTRTLTAALKRVIKQLLGTYSTTRVKYYKQTMKTFPLV